MNRVIRSIIEGGNSAATCTCGDDLARNGGSIHNYSCPMTPKCQHMVSHRDLRTGETTHTPCGSRLESQYACHSYGCPCLPLCPHCGTSMDRRGVHSIGCPNRPNYSHRDIQFRDIIPNPDQNIRNFLAILVGIMRDMPVSPPQIIAEDFEVRGDCSICQESCDSSQSVMKPSGCDHCFHADCFTPWINNHSTCPNCRCETQTILRKN